MAMIIGAHSIIYSKKPDADRAFLRDVLRLPNVDVGSGWLIFGLPPWLRGAVVVLMGDYQNATFSDMEGTCLRDAERLGSLAHVRRLDPQHPTVATGARTGRLHRGDV